ncbi:leucine-rich repeat domain-containing protein [Ruminococcus sp. FC2018]|uniref:leucine-rich repeat domain-containing protein n=1 Tax=Ruminococcus sp. FC2018 TaxID=1410617 RepID=UPI00048D98FB|nr:leucine-rich repeat domain-containing protein [Ruminococcus sp. FC2018]
MGFEISKTGLLAKYIKEDDTQDVVVPETIKGIGKDAFKGIEGITSVKLGAKIKKITVWGFIKCSDLLDINVSKNNPNYSSRDGVLYNKDGTVLLFMPQGRSELVIPEGVVEIGDYACSCAFKLNKVVLPSTLKTIGKEAFLHCSFEQIAIPKSVESISENAFADCTKLRTVRIDAKLEAISSYSFAFCKKLEEVNIPESVKTIDIGAFDGCSSLKSIVFSDGLKTIGHYAFKKCISLKSIIIPKSVERIQSYAFEKCVFEYDDVVFKSNETVMEICAFPDSVLDEYTPTKLVHSPDEFIATPRPLLDQYITKSGVLKKVPKKAHRWHLKIPEGVKEIAADAFSGSAIIRDVTFPTSLTKIGDRAFSECENLKKTIFANGLETIGESAFEKCSIVLVELPNSLVTVGMNAFCENYSLRKVVVPSSVKTIEEGAFHSSRYLQRLLLSEGIEEIGPNAFYNCPVLDTIVLPKSLTKIGDRAFCYLDPDDDEVINEWINAPIYCYENSAGEEYAIKNNFEHRPYDEADNDPYFIIKDGVLERYFGESGKTELIIPAGVKEIGRSAFYKCDELEHIIIPNGVTIIGDGAFAACYNLSEITIPESVVSLGFRSFSDCRRLERVIVENNDISIDDTAFELCFELKGLTYINDPDAYEHKRKLALRNPETENNQTAAKTKQQIVSTSKPVTPVPVTESAEPKKSELVKTADTVHATDAVKPVSEVNPDSPNPSSPADVKPAEPAPVEAEAAAPQVASAEYIPPVFPPRINDLEIKRFYEYTDPFADVNGKEFAVFIDEFYYASCIDYLNRNGAKVVLCPSENTDYILVELPNYHKAFYYAHKVGFKGKFTLVDDIKKYLTEEEREYYHYCEDVVGFEFSYEPKIDFEKSCELMYAVYDVVLGELNKCRTRPYGESIRYVTSITSCLGSSKPDNSYNDMIDWIKGKEADENFDKYEQLIYGMSFEDKLCAVMYALARYEWTGYEDDESMCDFAYKLTQKWFRKKEKPKLKEKITEDVAYLRLKFKDIDKSERFDGIGLKYYVPYVDLMRFEWAKERLCVVARTDKKQKVLKSDVFSAQQGDVNLYVCYAANPEKEDYYYLDNTQPFQWRMTPVEIWNAAKEKIVWLSKKEMPANIPERIDTSISELEELGKNGRKKMLDKIKKQAAQLEKYTHKIDPESVPCFADLGAVIKELEENKAKIQQQAEEVEAELRAVDSKLREAFDQQSAQVPSAVKKKDTEAEIARLTDEKSHLGFFKGKQKKALQAQIDELNAQLPQLDSAIAAEKQDQKAKYDPIITELGTQKSQLQQRLKELKDLIAEADSTIASLKF